MPGLKPKEITADRNQNFMIVTWSDGHVSHYPFSLLRHACPCAECRGGHEHMQSDPDPLVFDLPDENSLATRLRSVEMIGAYALSITWEDGHYYGIYTWHYLRALCPCHHCRQRGENAG